MGIPGLRRTRALLIESREAMTAALRLRLRLDLRVVSVLCAAIALLLVMLPASALGEDEHSQTRMVLLPEARAIRDANRPMAAEVPRGQLERHFREMLYGYSDFSAETAELLRATEKTHNSDSDSDSDAGTRNWEIRPEQAAEEVGLLFGALKFGYAGYQFFGGDAAFGAAKDAILREISDLSALCDAIPIWRYLDAITGHLDFVQDAHLAFANRHLCVHSTFSLCPFYEFTLSAGAYLDSDGRRLMTVNGDEPSGYLKPSIGEDGAIVYMLGMTSSERHQDTVLELRFEGGSTEMGWLIPAAGAVHDGVTYELVKFEGLQMAVCRTFGISPDNSDDLSEFVKDAEGLRHEDVILLDLRSNPGGIIHYGQEWCKRLFGDVGPFLMTANLLTDTALVLRMNQRADANDELNRIKDERCTLMDAELPGWSIAATGVELGSDAPAGAGPTAAADADAPFVLVLTDSGTASASEALIRCLRCTGNAVTVGTNTGGALLTGNPGLLRLPYSGLRVRIPTMIWMDYEMRNLDGEGYSPDFWVHPDLAGARAVMFARRYLEQQMSGR